MRKHIINESQRGLLIQKGRIVQEVGPGIYYSSALLNKVYEVFPIMPQLYDLANNFSTQDMSNVFVDLPINIYIEDMRKLYLSSVNSHDAVNRVVANSIQEYVASKSLAELLQVGIEIQPAAINQALNEFGLKVSIEGPARIRLPRNLQNAIDAQEVARQKAKAELEEARGRTAVLRHYANTARMTKDNPELLRLLLGQKAKAINVAFDAPK